MRHKYEVNRAGKELKKTKSYGLFLHYSQGKSHVFWTYDLNHSHRDQEIRTGDQKCWNEGLQA